MHGLIYTIGKTENMIKENFEIRFLLHGKPLSVIVDKTLLTVFYQEKLEEINVISVNKTEIASVSEIRLFLKPKKSIYEGLEI